MFTTQRFSYGIALVGLFFMGLTWWINSDFGRVSIDQIQSTLTFGIEGALTADHAFFKHFAFKCIIVPLISFFIFFRLFKIKYVSYLIFATGFIAISYQVSLSNFIGNLFITKPDYFKTNYINPGSAQFTAPKNKKSLVIIYVESLEDSYSNKKIFGHDLLTSLNKLKNQHNYFDRFQQMPGTSWTIAGIVSTQCGIPLKTFTIFSGNKMGQDMNTFLPGASCLSDILAKNGYKNIFMKGSSLVFAGTDKFIETHHYQERYGKEEWLHLGFNEKNMSGWGLYDNDLFEQAKLKLHSLLKDKQPFHLTLLTVDTHGVNGQLNQHCKQKGFHDFDGIVECTSNEVADFVQYIQHQKGWLDQLNIVILGDHLAMKNLSSDKLAASPNRYLFNLIISKQSFRKNTDIITEFDVLPTLLDLLGFHYNNTKLGLGYSALLPHPAMHTHQELSDMAEQLANQSKTYNALWI